MNNLELFLPCAGGVEPYLQMEVAKILGEDTLVKTQPGGLLVQTTWRDAMLLNLHSRLANRVLVSVKHEPYRHEQDVYDIASDVAWEIWFTHQHTFKIDVNATRSPLQSINFAALRVKDAICDRFRAKSGSRPSVDTHYPQVRVYLHLGQEAMSLYIDTSGEPLFKRGWRQDKGDAPLKETLAAAMLSASGWWKLDAPAGEPACDQPLYDPCCGSGTVLIEAAQIALNLPAGGQRRFGFERLLPYQAHTWDTIKSVANNLVSTAAIGKKGGQPALELHGSDVAHRMVDFAQRNAELAGVASVVQLRGGDALQRKPPCPVPPQGAVMVSNPPYGERIDIAGVARADSLSRGERAGVRVRPPTRSARETAEFDSAAGSFFNQLATHWKTHFDGWTAHLLVPDMKLPSKMRLKETRRVPLWNGPIECRLFRFDIRGRSQAVPE